MNWRVVLKERSYAVTFEAPNYYVCDGFITFTDANRNALKVFAVDSIEYFERV